MAWPGHAVVSAVRVGRAGLASLAKLRVRHLVNSGGLQVVGWLSCPVLGPRGLRMRNDGLAWGVRWRRRSGARLRIDWFV